MRIVSVLLVLLLVLPLSGCKNGASTMPELSGMIFEAIKSGNKTKLEQAAPNAEGLQKIMQTYFLPSSLPQKEKEARAADTSGTILLKLSRDYSKVTAMAEKWNFDLKNSQLADYTYETRTREEGFMEGTGHIRFRSGETTRSLRYTAYQWEGKWYLIERLEWEN